MDKAETINRILDLGIIAILRMDTSDTLMHIVEALYEGGVTVMEIPMTTPDSLQTIAGVKKKFGDQIVMGVGSVLDTKTARAAMVIGSDFVVTPVTNPDVIKTCNRYLKPVISGVYTPTEAYHAYEAGADFIKIFPADNLGPSYIRNLLAPMPMLKLIPTGGVTVENVPDYISAGSTALAAANSLIPKDAIQSHDWDKITQCAVAFMTVVKMARASQM